MTALFAANCWSTVHRYSVMFFAVAALILSACQDDQQTASVEQPQQAPADQSALPHIKEFVSHLIHENDTDNQQATTHDETKQDSNLDQTNQTSKPQQLDAKTKLLLSHLPKPLDKTLPNFNAYPSVAKKKQAFFDYLLPLAENTNRYVQSLRDELLAMDANHLTPPQQQRLASLAKSYKVKAKQPKQQLDTLLKKIYPIPTALTLAQAANESGWGTSRFAMQWCFSKGCGMVPAQRSEGSRHEVKVFSTPEASVAAYVKNLNSHDGYINLRQIRHCLNQQGQTVLGQDLAHGLNNYSSRGMAYVNEITQLIKQNQLEPWVTDGWAQDSQHPCAPLIKTTDLASN